MWTRCRPEAEVQNWQLRGATSVTQPALTYLKQDAVMCVGAVTMGVAGYA